MKPNHLFTSLLAVTALFVASCSTPKLAKNNAIQDDVYNTTAQAKEYIAPAPRPEPIQYQDETTVTEDSYYGNSDPYYDMDYTSRIDRFYYASPWRSYFGYNDFYGYNSFYSPYSFGLGGFYGNVYNNWGFNSYLNWGLYGAPYYSNFWGPYSWYNPYGGFYGGGWGGGGFYGGGFAGGGTNANYRPRPSRGSENGVGRANGTYMGGGTSRTNGTNVNGNNGVGRSRAEMYNPATNGTSRAGNSSSTRSNGNAAPSRSDNGSSRPTRSNDAPQQSRPTYNPPAQSSPPPSSSGSSRGGGSSSSGGGGGGGRPTRGGR